MNKVNKKTGWSLSIYDGYDLVSDDSLSMYGLSVSSEERRKYTEEKKDDQDDDNDIDFDAVKVYEEHCDTNKRKIWFKYFFDKIEELGRENEWILASKLYNSEYKYQAMHHLYTKVGEINEEKGRIGRGPFIYIKGGDGKPYYIKRV